MGKCRDGNTQTVNQKRLGGARAVLFVYAMQGLENMAYISNAVSLVTYFYGYMNFSLMKSATTLTNWLGSSFLLVLFGGFISDTYLSRFRATVLFGCIELVGYTLLTVQAHSTLLRPFPCKDVAPGSQCEAADYGQVAVLLSGLYLVALGTGGVKAGLPSLGADQFDEKDPKETGVDMVCKANGKRTKKMAAREKNKGLIPFYGKFLITFLDRAAIMINAHSSHSLNMTGSWYLCTVTQVEETKILIRMLPIIISTIFMNTCLAQLQTFSVQQSTTMDTGILGFHVPGPSLPVIPMVIMAIMVPIYDGVFVPLARKFTGIPRGVQSLQRIGVGLVLSAISMAIAGIMETRRKSVAVEHNMVDSLDPLPMSIFWLGFQYAIFGAADMFTLVGLLEFFYAESSAGMKSLSTAISWSSMAFGYYLSSLVVEVVNKVSGGWLASNNLNRDELNYFYRLLSGLSVLNFGFYLLCASWYRYKKVEEVKQIGGNDFEGKVNVEIGKVNG
ncbi:hypothetical protein IFM89_032080 [Coptis chinensis]|uniref:Uncharacterized protein n=1 Tax=Coptis chinensis TaxID=261450 RepID=A0A835M5F9_9MAGN|nr:hypothetical protein IFM89_032080 [Coptis chinensis]